MVLFSLVDFIYLVGDYESIECILLIFNLLQFSEFRNSVLKKVSFVDNICPICGRVFKRKDHVQRHYLELHIFSQENMGYACLLCDRLFKRRYILDHHAKTCTGARKCPFCKLYFPRLQDFLEHMKIVHSDHTWYKIQIIYFCKERFLRFFWGVFNKTTIYTILFLFFFYCFYMIKFCKMHFKASTVKLRLR